MKSGKTRVTLEFDKNILEKLKFLAQDQDRPRKNYMENVLIAHVLNEELKK